MKRVLAALLVFMLSLQLTAGLKVQAASFTDINDTYANARVAIQKWADYGIIGGVGNDKFAPRDYFKRYQMAIMMDKIMAYTQEAPNSYTDLEGSVFAGYILRCAAAGVFDNGGAFRPEDYITREEAAVAFARALGVDFDANSITPTNFVDDASISASARGAIIAMVARGVLNGMPAGTDENGVAQYAFKPQDYIYRQDMAVMFSMALDALVNTAGDLTASNKTYANSVVINKSGAVLSNATILGDLIIAEGVGTGDVVLTDVKVAGQLLVKAGGENSLYINGQCAVNKIKVSKKSADPLAIKVSGDATINTLDVAEGAVVIKGTDGDKAPVINNVTLTSKADLTIGANVTVETLSIAQSANGSSLTIEGTVNNLDVTANNTTIVVDASVGVLNITGNNVNVVIIGDATGIVITGNNVTLTVQGSVGTIDVAASGASIVITEDAKVDKVVVDESASKTEITNNGAIAVLDLNAVVTMENNGEIATTNDNVVAAPSTPAATTPTTPAGGGGTGDTTTGGGGTTGGDTTGGGGGGTPTAIDYDAKFIQQLRASADANENTKGLITINGKNITIDAKGKDIFATGTGLVTVVQSYLLGTEGHYTVASIVVAGTGESTTGTQLVSTDGALKVDSLLELLEGVFIPNNNTIKGKVTLQYNVSASINKTITFDVTITR